MFYSSDCDTARRAQQLLSQGSIPEHSMTTDVLTGPVAGKSRSQ